MKKFYLTLAILFQGALLLSQTVSDIKVEQAGDFIRISYKISNSDSQQLFRIKALCSINGGLNTELRSVSGDVGENIIGGKEEYWILWDVLKDVESLESVEFIVRAELINPNILGETGLKQRKKPDGSFTVMPLFEFKNGAPSAGITIGYLGKVGITASYTRELEPSRGYPDEMAFDPFGPVESQMEDVYLSKYTLAFTARLINRENFKLHLLTGAGAGKVIVGDPDYKNAMAPCVEYGTVMFIKRLSLSLAVRNILANLSEEGTILSEVNFVSLGAGIRF